MVQPVQRVFLIAHYNLYQTKRHFLAQVAEGFRRCGIEVQLAELRDLMEDEYCQQIRDFKPDMTVTFTVFHQDNQGLFLWDYLKIPHLFILVDPALFSCEPIQSPFSMIACVDSFDIDFLAAQDFRRSFFLPHGVDRDYVTQPLIGEKEHDAVFIGSYYDFDGIRAFWQSELPAVVCKALDDAGERVLSDNETHLAVAMGEAFREAKLDASKFDFKKLASYVDDYTRGYDRVQLIKSITDARVDVYGTAGWMHGFPSKKGWDTLKAQKNVTVHPPLKYQAALDLLRRSRICLNSMPFFKGGLHERLLNGLAAGCVVVTSENSYIDRCFKPDQGVVQYRFKNRAAANDLVNGWLSDEDRRERAVASGRQLLIERHTWDHRVEEILSQVPPLIEGISKAKLWPSGFFDFDPIQTVGASP